MAVTGNEFQSPLNFLVSIEPAPEAVNGMAQYNALMAPNQAAIAAAKATIRDYGEQIAHEGLRFMRDELQFILDQQTEPLAISVITSTVNLAWDGCGQWQA